MTASEFVGKVPGFSKLGPTDQIRALAWYIHVHARAERFTAAELVACFDLAHLHKPNNLHQLVKQLIGKDLIKDAKGLRLAKDARDKLDLSYRDSREETVIVDKLLTDLPAKLSGSGQTAYLDEALVCFRHKAFRAAVVMTWNVAYDHLLGVIVDKHLPAFNTQMAGMFGGKKKAVAVRDDFQKLKESEVLEVCNAGSLVSKEVWKVLDDKLDKRNSAAHPSGSTFNKMMAEAYISDLIENAVMKIQ